MQVNLKEEWSGRGLLEATIEIVAFSRGELQMLVRDIEVGKVPQDVAVQIKEIVRGIIDEDVWETSRV